MSELRYCCVVSDDGGKPARQESGKCPLQNVSLTGLIRDTVAQSTVVQTYVNPLEDAAIEAVYSFPLYEGVAVCGFEAEVDGRKIVGRVQEKIAARKEYESAKKAGKVASLLEEETPDTFQASVGNIPPSKTVVIRITLVSESKQDGEENQVRFVMPTTIAPRYGYSPVTGSSGIDTSFTVLKADMGCAMSKAITSIESPSHTIKVHLGTTSSDVSSTAVSFDPNRARVSLTADSLLDRDLVIVVQALRLDAPRALVERHPRDGTHAISLTFSPRFELNPIRSLELFFIVDRSGSMSGTPIRKAGAALELFLRSIPCEDHYFNVIGFGSSHQALFPRSVAYNADSLKRGTVYAERMEADLGGTEMMSAFQEVFKQRRRDMSTQIFLLTDGEIWDVDPLCEVIREAVDEAEKSNSSVRVFSLGIGDSVSHHLIESVARAGGGYAQHVVESERMEKKVLNMLKSALVPAATNLGVRWTSEMDPADQEEEFVLVEAEVSAPPPPVEDPNDQSDSTNKTPINLFSTSPEVPSPPPPAPALPPPSVVVPIHQAPFNIPILSRGARFTIYAILSSTVPVPKELVLQGSSLDGPVELKVMIETVQEGETMLHSLAARAIVRDLEEGTSCIHALGKSPTATQKEMLKRLGVHVVNSEGKRYSDAQLSSKHVTEIAKEQVLDIAMRYSLSSKYTSWVAIDEDTARTIIHDIVDRPQYSASSMQLKKKSGFFHMSASAPPMPPSMPSSAFGAMAAMAAPAFGARAAMPMRLSGRCYARARAAPPPGGILFQQQLQQVHYPAAMAAHEAEVLEDVSADIESEEPITASDPHSQLRSILQLQSFDGSFPLVPEIAAFFSTTAEDLKWKLAEVRKKCALSTLSESEWETIWATCLAVEFIKRQLPELQDEWELVVEKAEKRVDALLKSVQDVAIVKEAAAGVAAAAGSSASSTTFVVGADADQISPAPATAAGSSELFEQDVLKTVAKPEVRQPLPCLIGVPEPATSSVSEECAQDVLEPKEAPVVAAAGDAQDAP